MHHQHQRRDFLWLLGGGIVLCKLGCDDEHAPLPPIIDATTSGADAPRDTLPPDATACALEMHDTFAQALYLDGSLGPLTGIVTVDHIVAGATITLDFWHGHNGIQHRWTLEPHHFAALKRGERITLTTTTVEDHAHTLFVDPVDESYRVPGAPDVLVTVGCMGTG